MNIFGRPMLIVQLNKFNYAEKYKPGYETCIAFFYCNDNEIKKASAKYKLYKRVSEPNRH